MPNFQPLAFIDPFELAASLRPKMGLFDKATEPLRLSVRGPRASADDPDDESGFVIYREAGKTRWPELHAMLGRIGRAAEQMAANAGQPCKVEFGKVWLELLQPGTLLPWLHEDSAYNARFWRLALALRSNPLCPLYSGAEAWSLQPGFLTMVNHRVPTSGVNLGETAAIRLYCDIRRKTDG